MVLCSNCKKRPALIFISSMHGMGKRNEGLCLVCANKLNIPQVAEYMARKGITKADLDKMAAEAIPASTAAPPLHQPSFIGRLFSSSEGQASTPEEMENLRIAQEIQNREQMKKIQQEQEEREKAILKQNGELCSLCQKRKSVISSKAHEYELCRECAWLLYPQIDIHQAETYNISIEEARTRFIPQHKCCVCGIRDSQIHSREGEYCIVCAKQNNMPEADIFASRMGISAEDLLSFAIKVKTADQAGCEKKNEARVCSEEKTLRFRILERHDVGNMDIYIVVDEMTGVQYLTNTQLSGFSPLLDTAGKPLLYRKEDTKCPN